MSTTATYKGNVIATVDDNTKTLKTAGKYMEGDVILTETSIDGDVVAYGTNLTDTTWTFNNTPAYLPRKETEFYINFRVIGDQSNTYSSIDMVSDSSGTFLIYGATIAYQDGTWYAGKQIHITGGTDVTNGKLVDLLRSNATQTG